MNVTIRLEGNEYEEGSAAHLEKIDEMHKAEIAKHNETHVQDITERRDLEDRARVLNKEMKDGVRQQAAALANANAATQQSEDHFRLLVNGVKDYALYMLDPSGNVASWNVGAERIKGYKACEIVGKHLSVFYQSKDVEDGQPQKNLVTAAQTGRAEQEGRRVRKDGSTFWANVVLSPIHDSTGVLIGFAKITRDLTERRDLELQLHQSQKMEAIGSLAGGVAHDFNNLLTVILNCTGFALAGLHEGDPLKDDLLEVTKAAERAAALTHQLLAFSRNQVLQPVVLNLNHVASGIEKMLRRILGEDIDFVQVLEPDLGLTLADPGQIEQVLMNLVVNARDAMPDGGKLTIETANVDIDEEYATRHVAVVPGHYVMLAVTDTGCGMDVLTRARLFEPFFTTKEKGKGTGLGLSTVYGIVKQSGGNVWVYSEPGQGTTFKFYLPRQLSATMAAGIKPPTVPRRATGTETILLVEDEAALSKVAKRNLDAAGYTVLAAADGDEALRLCAQHTGDIHLLLTDVVMPRISGRTLALELTKTRPTLKVLYMSGYTGNAIGHHGVLDAGTHFIAKPFTAANLARKVREVLDGCVTNIAVGNE